MKSARTKTINPPVKKIKTDTLYSNIKSKKSVVYKCNAKQISLSIWDDLNADGDKVSIYLDGKLILKNYELRKAKKPTDTQTD